MPQDQSADKQIERLNKMEQGKPVASLSSSKKISWQPMEIATKNVTAQKKTAKKNPKRIAGK